MGSVHSIEFGSRQRWSVFALSKILPECTCLACTAWHVLRFAIEAASRFFLAVNDRRKIPNTRRSSSTASLAISALANFRRHSDPKSTWATRRVELSPTGQVNNARGIDVRQKTSRPSMQLTGFSAYFVLLREMFKIRMMSKWTFE